MEEAERRRLASSRFEVVRVHEDQPVKRRSLVDLIQAANETPLVSRPQSRSSLASQSANGSPQEVRMMSSRSQASTPSLSMTETECSSSSRLYNSTGNESESAVLIESNIGNPEILHKEQLCGWSCCSKVVLSLTVSAVIMIIGVVLIEALKIHREIPLPVMNFLYVFRAIGIFGFSGGAANWVAIKLVFYRIPGLIGSGVIPRHYMEIKQRIKSMVIEIFFEQEFLSRYLAEKGDAFLSAINLEDQMKETTESGHMDVLIDKQIKMMVTEPEGAMFKMVGMDSTKLKSFVKSLICSISNQITHRLLVSFKNSTHFTAEHIRHEVEAMIVTRMENITAKQVIKIVEELVGPIEFNGNLLMMSQAT
ncbi:uncharacterized protein [Ptychodera flava]|uniref:uncharacterized protein isoform X2 n=1 Tax=Ptychodera flava TaxID=63121 RepID=UPI00396A7A4B